MKQYLKSSTKILILFFIALASLLFGASSCSGSSRTPNQRERVTRHLEQKYGEKFQFIDYQLPRTSEDLKRYFFSYEGLPLGNYVTVTVSENADGFEVFQDNFMVHFFKGKVLDFLEESVTGVFDDGIVTIYNPSGTDLPDTITFDTQFDDYLKIIPWISMTIEVPESSFVSEDQLIELVEIINRDREVPNLTISFFIITDDYFFSERLDVTEFFINRVANGEINLNLSTDLQPRIRWINPFENQQD